MDHIRAPLQVRIVAVVIWILSRDSDLAFYYVISRRTPYALDDIDVTDRARTALLLATWMLDCNVAHEAEQCLLTLDRPHRLAADSFLVKSVLVAWIVDKNRSGISVDLQQAIIKLIQLWSYRPTCVTMAARLNKLTFDRHARRRFGVDLRIEWCLAQNAYSVPRELCDSSIKAKVLQFHTNS